MPMKVYESHDPFTTPFRWGTLRSRSSPHLLKPLRSRR